MTFTSADPLGLDRFVPGRAQAEVRPVELSGLETGTDRAVHDDHPTVIWVETDDADDLTLSSATAAQLERAVRTAHGQRIPVVITIATSGVDIVEGMAALDGWGRVARALTDCSGVVPTILVVDGPVVSGPALLCGVADVVVMTEAASAFVNGPVMVEQFTGVEVDVDELGGVATHQRYTGVATTVTPDRASAHEWVRELLAHLPTSVDVEPPRWPSDDPADRSCPEAGARIPSSSTGSYDVRDVAADIADDGSFLELR
ncbi:MAG: carboxyl transferase domain-containing protein, partial [Actinomycetota bacterium]